MSDRETWKADLVLSVILDEQSRLQFDKMISHAFAEAVLDRVVSVCPAAIVQADDLSALRARALIVLSDGRSLTFRHADGTMFCNAKRRYGHEALRNLKVDLADPDSVDKCCKWVEEAAAS